MITIHDKQSTAFDTLGIGVLLPSSVEITQAINGGFELAMTHPYDSFGKWKRIEQECILYANTPSGPQPFRIYSINPDMDQIEIKARHIFYDLLDNVCKNINITGTAQSVMQEIQYAMTVPMPFSFSSNINAMGTISATYDNPISLLLNDDDDTNSFVKSFGGEILRDGFHVFMLDCIGQDKGVLIAYRKNLVGLNIVEDISDVATRIYPIGKDGLMLSGDGYVDSPYINNYIYPKIKVIEDSSVETESELEQLAQSFFDSGGDLPMVNIQIDFVDLSQTTEYQDFRELEKVQLGDIVTIINKKMGFQKKAKVISYKYDSLMMRYNEIELGDFSPNVTTQITKGARSGSVAASAKYTANQTAAAISGVATILSDGMYICIDGQTVGTSKKYFRFGQSGLEFTNDSGVSWKTIIDIDGNVI